MYYLSDSSVKQLDYVLNCIRSAAHHVDNRKDFNLHTATDYDTETLLSPHLFYHFQFREKYCQIERLGNKSVYAIRCHGFKPLHLGAHFTFSLEQTEYQREIYGSFQNIDECIHAFAVICTELVQYIQPVLLF